MRMKPAPFASITAVAVVLVGGQAPAFADRATFHDPANDVVNVDTGNVTTTAAGVDVRAIRITFSERAMRVRIHHKDLTPSDDPDDQDEEDRIVLDTRGANRGPEWVMVFSELDYDLYRIDNFFQAEHPKARMRRTCGDTVHSDYRGDTTTLRLPSRCQPAAHRVRTTGTFMWKPEGRAMRVDHFLGYHTWTPWVRRH
jgi:hypothetical protein